MDNNYGQRLLEFLKSFFDPDGTLHFLAISAVEINTLDTVEATLYKVRTAVTFQNQDVVTLTSTAQTCTSLSLQLRSCLPTKVNGQKDLLPWKAVLSSLHWDGCPSSRRLFWFLRKPVKPLPEELAGFPKPMTKVPRQRFKQAF